MLKNVATANRRDGEGSNFCHDLSANSIIEIQQKEFA